MIWKDHGQLAKREHLDSDDGVLSLRAGEVGEEGVHLFIYVVLCLSSDQGASFEISADDTFPSRINSAKTLPVPGPCVIPQHECLFVSPATR
jgi:hypothetical protein